MAARILPAAAEHRRGPPLEIGEMVRAAVLNLAMPHATSLYQTVTVSVGVACTRPNAAQQPGDLIEAADAALYAASTAAATLW